MPDFADPEWFEKETRKRAIERDANDALRELHLQGKFDNDPVPYALTPVDEQLLREMGISMDDQERTGSIYHDLPVSQLSIIDRSQHVLIRGAILADLTALIERVERSQPSATYARTIIEKTYCDALVATVPEGGLARIRTAIDDLTARRPDEPIPAQYFYDLWLRVCPDGPSTCASIRSTMQNLMMRGWGC